MCWMKDRGWVLVPTSIFSCASFACLCVAVVTDHWLYASERLNSTNLFRNTTAGLWRKCIHDVSTTPSDWCERIDYFKHIERDGLAPTDSILLSLRKFAWFPLLSLLILLVGECCCVVSHCNPQKNTLTLMAGIMFVIGGLFVLIGIVVFIGAVTEEASNSNKSRPSADDQMKVFHYRYGPSFILTIFSFISSESTGVLSVYLYISLYQMAYRKDRDHLEIPVDVNSEALTQVPGEHQSLELDFRAANMHLKNPLLSSRVYPEEEDDFSADGVSPLVDSIGSDAALLTESGKQSKIGNSLNVLSSKLIQKNSKNILSTRRHSWKLISNTSSTALKPQGIDESVTVEYPDCFEHRQQTKSSQRKNANSKAPNVSGLMFRSNTSDMPIFNYQTSDHQQQTLRPSQQHSLQQIQRRFQLIRQDSLHKQNHSKLPTKLIQQKSQKKTQQHYGRHDWLTNSPSPTTMYKDTATQYSPLLSQASNHNSFKTFETSSFKKGFIHSPEFKRPREDYPLREERIRNANFKRDFNANQIDRNQELKRGSVNRPCCCQPHPTQHHRQNPDMHRRISSSFKHLDGHESVAHLVSESPLTGAGFLARSAHYLPQCGLTEDDWGASESSVDRARSMHELRYFSYCNPQHLKSLVRPLLNEESNFYFGRTTPV